MAEVDLPIVAEPYENGNATNMNFDGENDRRNSNNYGSHSNGDGINRNASCNLLQEKRVPIRIRRLIDLDGGQAQEESGTEEFKHEG